MGMNHTYHTWETFPCHFAQFLNSTDPQTQQILLYTSKTASGLEFYGQPDYQMKECKNDWMSGKPYRVPNWLWHIVWPIFSGKCHCWCYLSICAMFKVFHVSFFGFHHSLSGPKTLKRGCHGKPGASDLPYFCLLQLRGLRALWQQHVDVGGSMMTSAILAGVMLIRDCSEVPRLNESSHKRTKEDERSDVMWMWMLYLEQQITWNKHRFMVVLVRVRGSLFAKSLSGNLWESQCFSCIFMCMRFDAFSIILRDVYASAIPWTQRGT